MSVLVLVELDEGKAKKSSLEAISYGKELGEVGVLVHGDIESDQFAELGKAGASKVFHAKSDSMEAGIMTYASAMAQLVEEENYEVVLFAKSSIADPVSARLSVKIVAGLVSNVTSLPDTGSGFKVNRSIYTGKAFATTEITTDKKILTLKKNAVAIKEDGGAPEVVDFQPSINEVDKKVKVLSKEKAEGDVLLPEADIVVSGGRGLKGPENWGMVEDLAKSLGAATGCSKPVSDMDWRPHHEHVGQTGIKVSPSLYIAIGISGAIQHLAGVNSSKYILVINKDAEAPFFKAADYGIVGDAFDVVPKLTEAIKAKIG